MHILSVYYRVKLNVIEHMHKVVVVRIFTNILSKKESY